MGVLGLLLLTACGRVGFDASGTSAEGDAARGDGGSTVEGTNGASPDDLVGVDQPIASTINGVTLDTDTGEIKDGATIIRPPGEGLIAGIRFQVRDGMGAFGTSALTVAPGQGISAYGENALLIVVRDDAMIGGALSVMAGTCPGGGSSPHCAGPGGGAGGTTVAAAQGCAPGGAG